MPGVLVFVITAVTTLALRPLALRVKLVDSPGGRKHHRGEIPLVGGLAMFIGILAGLAYAADTVAGLSYFVVAATVLVTVGVIDDHFGIGVWLRFCAQGAAALIMMIGADLYLHDIGDPFGSGRLGLGWAAIPLSLLITMTVINAFNFIDGIDGLAGSMALIALGAGALAAGIGGSTVGLAIMTGAAVLGFLVFNFPTRGKRRLRTFMGDAGSTLLGFIVVWFIVSICQGEDRALSPVPALWFALVPLTDLFSCFYRRLVRGKLPLAPGREHLHHVLMRAGLSARQTLAVLVGLALVYAAVGLIGARLQWPDWPLFMAWMVLLCTQYGIIRRLAVLIRYRRITGEAIPVTPVEARRTVAGEIPR